jgi:voltage-gated potassium channel
MARGGVLRRIASAYGERRYTFLFYLLLLTFVVNPLMAVIRPRGHALDLFLWLNLVAAAVGIRTRRGWVLAVLGLVAVLGLEMSTHRRIGALSYALWALLALIAAATAIRFTLHAREVGAEQMYAALSAYLLTGLFFGAIHWSVEDIWPGSYAASTGAPLTPSTAIYFSFVTLATVGYGDVVPAREVSRGVAMFEALAGQLYLAVLIARLVSVYVGRR